MIIGGVREKVVLKKKKNVFEIKEKQKKIPPLPLKDVLIGPLQKKTNQDLI